MRAFAVLVVAAAVVFGLYYWRWQAPGRLDAGGTDAAVQTVTRLGEAMQHVPLAGDADTARTAMREQYGPLVTRELLAAWQGDLASAPGRRVSSPWPARIEPDTLVAEGPDRVVVTGRVVEITSKELVEGGAAREIPVRVAVERADGAWRIVAYEAL